MLIGEGRISGICIDFVLTKLRENHDSIENHRQTGGKGRHPSHSKEKNKRPEEKTLQRYKDIVQLLLDAEQMGT